MAGIRDWSQLNPDLLHSISETLIDISDHVRFRSVCSKWRAAAGPIPPHPRHLPYLLLIPRNGFLPSPCHVIAPLDPHRQIYTLQTNSSLRLRSKYCFGSLFGRFLVVSSYCNFVSVFDPLPGGRWTDLPPQIPVNIDEYGCWRGKILSVDPYLILIVLICDSTEMLTLVWRQGDDEWLNLAHPEDIDPEDVTLYNGMYYFVGSRNTTYVVSSSTLQPIHKFICPEMAVYDDWDSRETFLVESSSGDLLMVVWNKDLSVLVFRMGGNKWEKATSIGDDTLFLDERNATCFPSGQFPGYLKNCVYIVPECDMMMPKVSIYDIAKDEVIESFEYLNGDFKAVWVSNAQ